MTAAVIVVATIAAGAWVVTRVVDAMRAFDDEVEQ